MARKNVKKQNKIQGYDMRKKKSCVSSSRDHLTATGKKKKDFNHQVKKKRRKKWRAPGIYFRRFSKNRSNRKLT